MNKDNERAAVALLHFPQAAELSLAFFSVLSDERSWAYPSFATYLVIGCSALAREDERKSFISLSHSQAFSSDLKKEMKEIINTWK